MPDLCPACRYGVWADWDSPYITLQPEYEAAQLRVFGTMFLNGHIYRWVRECERHDSLLLLHGSVPEGAPCFSAGTPTGV